MAEMTRQGTEPTIALAHTLTVFCLALAASIALARPALGRRLSRFLRDAEIENNIRTWATPIWTAAGLDPHAVHIYIINDPTLNSFVAGGQNLFMNTGTLLRADRPNEIIGIMAHETGHIAGGHLVRFEEEMHERHHQGHHRHGGGRRRRRRAGSGAAAMGAGMAAGESVGLRSYLSFSVAQEASADQAALNFLDATHQSARGLLDFFEILEQEEFLRRSARIPICAPTRSPRNASIMCASTSPNRRGRKYPIRRNGCQFQRHEGQARRVPQPAQQTLASIQGRRHIDRGALRARHRLLSHSQLKKALARSTD